MSAGTYSATALRAIRAEEVSAYLVLRGWLSEAAAATTIARVWYRGEDQTGATEIILPTQEEVVDYPIRMAELLRVLERVERRPQADILRDLTLSSADVIRVRRPTPVVTEESIVLHDGAALVQQAVNLMTAAACAAVNPRAVIPSRRPAQAADYLRRVRMGQTERGSYILTIVSAVAPLLTPGAPGLLEFMGEPFPRKVTHTLARSLSAIQEASDLVTRSGDFAAFGARVGQGVSANLCDAVRGMVSREDYEAEVGLSISWAATSEPPRDAANTFRFEPTVAPLLAEAAEYLRQTEPQEGALITGVVVGLHRPEGEWDGRITVACVIDGSVRQLQVSLPGAAYQRAVDAHGAQQAVLFRADIAKVGRSYRASNIAEFRIIDQG